MQTLRNSIVLLVLLTTLAYAASFNGVALNGVSFDAPPPAGLAPADWCQDSSAIFCTGFGQAGVTKTNNAATGSAYNMSTALGMGFQGSGCLGPSPSCFDSTNSTDTNASLAVSGRGCVINTDLSAGNLSNLCTGPGNSVYNSGGTTACCTGNSTGSCTSMAQMCVSANTPFACCTGLGTGSGCGGLTNGFCSGVGTPFSCCTGVGAGNCIAAIPCPNGQSDCGNGTGNTVGGSCFDHSWPAYASCDFNSCSLLKNTGTGGSFSTKFTVGCAAKINDLGSNGVIFGNTGSSGLPQSTGKGWAIDRHLGGATPEFVRLTLSNNTLHCVGTTGGTGSGTAGTVCATNADCLGTCAGSSPFNSDQTLFSHCVGTVGGTGSGAVGATCNTSADCLGICTGFYHVALAYDQTTSPSLEVFVNGNRSPAAGPATKVCNSASGGTNHNKVCTSDADCNNVTNACVPVAALQAADGSGFVIGGSTPGTSINGNVDQCWGFDNIIMSTAGVCRIQRCGPTGVNCRCDSTTPTNYKSCASNLDCGGGVCDLVSGSPTNGKCAGNPLGVCASGANANQTCTANSDCPGSSCTICSPTATCNAAAPS